MLLKKIWALVFSICICYLAYPKDTSVGPKSAKFEFPRKRHNSKVSKTAQVICLCQAVVFDTEKMSLSMTISKNNNSYLTFRPIRTQKRWPNI